MLLRGLVLLAVSTLFCFAQTKESPTSFWLTVTEQDRQIQTPSVDKSAGVEALFTRVYVADEFRGGDAFRAFRHYIRLKVFNDQGKEQVSTIDIPYFGNNRIDHVAARTTKPDGTVVDVKDGAIFDREIVRNRGLKRKVKSFALPAVEVGSIVEYRYTEYVDRPSLMYVALQFQRDFPVRKATISLWPIDLQGSSYRMYFIPFNCNPPQMTRDPNGYFSSTLENIPAFREEPMMPGEPNVRPWALATYRDDENRKPDKYWQKVGKKAYDDLRLSLKANDEMKRAAMTATAEATTDPDRVVALIRFVQSSVRGLFSSSVTDAERANVMKDLEKGKLRTSQQVLKSGVGTSDEMNTLFAALASAVGLDARPAFVADRTGSIFDPGLADLYFLPNIDMAVQIGGTWKVYDVSTRHLAPGMLSWREEGMAALISDPKKSFFEKVPLSPPEASASTRASTFSLSADGTLEGDVVETHTGHRAGERRLGMLGDSSVKRDETLKDSLRSAFPGAEVTSIVISNVEDASKPLMMTYHLRVPGYAQRTGRRLLFQPLVLQRGDAPLFSASERRYPIMFPYSYTESDNVAIRLPDGMELDHPDVPGNINADGFLTYTLKLTMQGTQLVATRNVVSGIGGNIVFPPDAYGSLKKVFDTVHERDNHVISLRAKSSAGTPSSEK